MANKLYTFRHHTGIPKLQGNIFRLLRTPLGSREIDCATHNGLIMCRMLLKSNAPLYQCDNEGATPLLLASRYAQKSCIQMLLAAGARKEGSAETFYIGALHNAAFNGTVECLQQLLDANAQVHNTDCDNWTPLHYATRFNHIPAIECLIEAKANVNAKDVMGYTPCHNASRNGLQRGVEILLQHGADMCVRNQYGETPLHVACRKV